MEIQLTTKEAAYLELVAKVVEERTKNQNLSVGIIIEQNAENNPEGCALLFDDSSWTWQILNQESNKIANYFLNAGIKFGDTIAVMMENSPEFLSITTGINKIQGISSMINVNQRKQALIHSFKISEPLWVIVDGDSLPAFTDVFSDLNFDKNKVFVINNHNNHDHYFIDFHKELETVLIDNPVSTYKSHLRDMTMYIFTSGTTGLPKAAHIRNMYTVTSINTWSSVILHMTPNDIMYICLPLFHSNALHLALSAAIGGGSAVAIARRFSVRNFWKDIKKFNATCFNYIGEICRYLFNQPLTPEDRNHRVYKICGNGLSPEIWKEFKERFGIREVYEHYGMTEMWGAFVNYINLDCTVGYNAAPYAIVKYNFENNEPERDNNGFLQEVEEGQAGLLIIQTWSDYVFAGYTDKKASEKKLLVDVFEKGDVWMNAGDIVRNIGYKHAQFVDRLGDTFRWKGENVSTTELEDLISSFEEIEHSSVYGVEIPGCEGRAGMASILASVEVEKFDFNNFLSTLQNKLPKYAIPRFVRFLFELSTTSTYKIQKYDMKKLGFNIKKTNNPIYVYLPETTKYTLLTERIYEDILNRKYRF